MNDPVNQNSSVKYCGRCGNFQLIALFAKNKIKKDGLQERCTPCRKEHIKKVKHLRKPQTKEQQRKYVIQSYGLTVDEFNKMLIEQNNVCAICESDDWGKPSPSIDHCHVTGKVRGLLCNNCNRALGLFKDKIGNIKNAINYLDK